MTGAMRGQPFLDVFVRCAQGVGAGKLITRESRQDKEIHFQNWFRARLTEAGFNFEAGGRNSYPDFRLAASTGGFEVIGLAYPVQGSSRRLAQSGASMRP